MTNTSMKRFSQFNNNEFIPQEIKRMHLSPKEDYNFTPIPHFPCTQRKRDEPCEEIGVAKRACCESDTSGFRPNLPDDVVKRLAFGLDGCSSLNGQLPPKAINDIKESIFKNSPSYKEQALILYQDPLNTQNKEEDEQEEELGKISYYYPCIGTDTNQEYQQNESNLMDESSNLSYQEQLRETGMRGVPPPCIDESSWIL